MGTQDQHARTRTPGALIEFTHIAHPNILRRLRVHRARPFSLKDLYDTPSDAAKYRYVGQVNDAGMPNGWGIWDIMTVPRPHSERLIGYWSDGSPRAPFRSREIDTGAGFDCVSFVWARHDGKTMQYGIASAECSVSGPFSYGYPVFKYYRCMEQVETVGGGEVNHENHGKLLLCIHGVKNIHPVFSELAVISSATELKAPQTISKHSPKICPRENKDFLTYQSTEECLGHRPSECIVFFHGYNTRLHEIPKLFGQLLAMANFPRHIVPISFIWRAGNNVLEYFTAKRNVVNPDLLKSVTSFFEHLNQLGMKRVHVITHSMGTRLFLNAWRDGAHRQFSEQHEEQPNLLALSSVTFLNPEYFMDDFLSVDFEFLKRHTTLMTVYGDARDSALRLSEILPGGHASMGRRVFGYIRGEHKQQPIPTPTPSQSPHDLKQTWDYGHHSAHPDRQWLDIDIINTTYVDQNIHAARHCYFNVNRLIIEDIREIIMDGNRAIQRKARLDRLLGNVFVYRSAPSCVTTFFPL
eukprot:GHVO01065302.1.p1 GENE.GHVO01065302.1~~GHVO01065302.1.p1  ORF type:complete len:548 (-),score=92.47 GHVO01065302.1:224-1795(-)